MKLPGPDANDLLGPLVRVSGSGTIDLAAQALRQATGDVDLALESTPFVTEGSFTTSFVEHAYIEPEAGHAELVPGADGRDRVRIFASTQTPYMDRDEIARILALDSDQVHIVPSAVGGGFGGKLDIAIQPLLALAAWKLKRPVRGVYTRPESMVSTTKRHPSRMRAHYGCEPSGRLLAMDFFGDYFGRGPGGERAAHAPAGAARRDRDAAPGGHAIPAADRQHVTG
jgi:CO/xanthine dehydrogenase Mo-binding subunit